jgi:hypothetical protein
MDFPCRYGDMRVRPLALDDYEEDPYGFEKKWSLYDADAQAEIDKYVFHSFALLFASIILQPPFSLSANLVLLDRVS